MKTVKYLLIVASASLLAFLWLIWGYLILEVGLGLLMLAGLIYCLYRKFDRDSKAKTASRNSTAKWYEMNDGSRYKQN